jgi:hypothetical protein
MKRLSLNVWAFLVLAGLVPSPAAGQLTAPDERAQIELGPVSVYPTIQLVDAGRDDNVFNENGTPRSDYTFTLASRALVVTRLGENELMFSSGNDYVWFKKYASERANNQRHALRFNLVKSRFKPFVGAVYSRTQSRPNAEIDLRAHRLERQVIVGSNFDLSARTAITMSAMVDDSRYDERQSFRGVFLDDALNRRGEQYVAGVRYAVTPLTTLQVTGNYREDVFPRSHLRDAVRYSVTPAAEFAPDAAIHGRFAAGYEIFKPRTPGFAEKRGLVMDGSLNWTTPSLTAFDLQVGRNVGYSYQESEPYYLSTGIRLIVTQRIIWNAEVVANGSRELLSYRWRDGVALPADASPRRDSADTYGAGIGIPLKRGFKVVLGVEQQRRQSKEHPETDYNRRRLISTMTVGY